MGGTRRRITSPSGSSTRTRETFRGASWFGGRMFCLAERYGRRRLVAFAKRWGRRGIAFRRSAACCAVTRMSKALGIHPAIIMEVDATDPELVDLTVFGPNGPEIWTRVPMTSAPPVAGRWHWPPRI